jgi:hypothetical protein
MCGNWEFNTITLYGDWERTSSPKWAFFWSKWVCFKKIYGNLKLVILDQACAHGHCNCLSPIGNV